MMVQELTFTQEEYQERRLRTRRMLTWTIIFAIVMFFAGLTSAYVVSMSGGYWVDIDLPQAFWISTATIFLSSISAQLALNAAKKGKQGTIGPMLVITLLLGCGFAWSQFQGWSEMVDRGQFVTGKITAMRGEYGVDYTISRGGQVLVLEDGQFYMPDDHARRRSLNPDIEEYKNTASSYVYALTGAHLFHLAFGLISLILMGIMAFMGRYTRDRHAGLWSGVVYWHFLGGLWVYLLLFLTFVH